MEMAYPIKLSANEGIFFKMRRVSLIITSIINKILIKEGVDDIQWISYNNFNLLSQARDGTSLIDC